MEAFFKSVNYAWLFKKCFKDSLNFELDKILSCYAASLLLFEYMIQYKWILLRLWFKYSIYYVSGTVLSAENAGLGKTWFSYDSCP